MKNMGCYKGYHWFAMCLNWWTISKYFYKITCWRTV